MPRRAQYSAMAPALVAAAVGALLAAALLGRAFDRRTAAVVVLAAVAPSLDAVLSLVVRGATNAALHTLLVPGLAALALYWDAERREHSTVRTRFGWRGVRTAWVVLAAYVVAGIGLELFVGAGANLFYPLHDRFYVVSGRLLFSTQEGVVQTYVELGGDGLLTVGSPGTTATHHVASWITPTPGTGLERGVERERELVIVESGWQAVLVIAAAAVLALRRREVP